MDENRFRGSFLPISKIFDTIKIHEMNVNSQEFKEFLVNIRTSITDIITVLNTKTTGDHELRELISGSSYFANPLLNSATNPPPSKRQEIILTINFGALPNTGTTNVPHGIIYPVPNTFKFVHIRATATDLVTPAALTIPYASPVLANNISIDVDAVNVSITTGSDRTAYTDTIVVLKYIKD